LRRLFSTFAHGSPGVGLLILRVVSGIALVVGGVTALRNGLPIEIAALEAATAGAGLLLFAGLWTPFAGGAVAVLELWSAVSRPGDPWICILLGAVGAALALLGPGAWSVDARLFGWKRIDIQDRQS
jgi:uncharacterized membrane protein YphA (DoxX/SURF4 family)